MVEEFKNREKEVDLRSRVVEALKTKSNLTMSVKQPSGQKLKISIVIKNKKFESAVINGTVKTLKVNKVVDI